MTEEYKNNLSSGLEFQDFVIDMFYSIGLPLISYSSKLYQIKIGENKAGIEIKFDRKFRETGNIYIETAEKSNKNNPEYILSGIYRDDNTWLYVIGDYHIIYILSKKQLKKAHERHRYKEVVTPTSKGFLIPISDIENRFSLKTLEFVFDKDSLTKNPLVKCK